MNAFHAHLEICKRCRERPFDLCAEGAELLEIASRKIGRRDILDAEEPAPGYGHGV